MEIRRRRPKGKRHRNVIGPEEPSSVFVRFSYTDNKPEFGVQLINSASSESYEIVADKQEWGRVITKLERQIEKGEE